MVVGMGRTIPRAVPPYRQTFRPYSTHVRAKAFFATLDSRNRYAVLFRIQTAKKAETRAKRIKQFAEMLSQHEKIHP